MRVLKGTLTFILGMVLGIILFVLAIGGAVFAIGSSMTVGQLQESLTPEEVIAKDSAIYSQKLIDAVKSIIGDVKNINSLSLKTLYEHYGISLLKGISGIDFTDKEFFSLPISDLIADSSKIVNSFTLGDISKLVGVDFSSYGLPVLNDNVYNNVQTALNNILSSLNGEMTIRSIKDTFGIDVGVGDNKLLATVQDVPLSSFGSVVNGMTLDKILNVDSDTFVKVGENDVYVKANNRYELVEKSALTSGKTSVGVESYIAGATDTDGDGTNDTLVEKELRYVKKTVKDESGNDVEKYVVDNSCYKSDFDAENNQKEFYRHVQYEKYTGASDEYFVLSYANKIVSFDGASFTLFSKGFLSLNDVYTTVGSTVVPFSSGVTTGKITLGNTVRKAADGSFENAERYFVYDSPVDKNTKLSSYEDGKTPVYVDCYERVHVGSSEQVLQLVAYMTITELQNADDLLNSLTVGDVVNPESSKIVKALKDCKLKDIGTKINTLKIDDVIDINDSSSIAMKSLAAHGATLENIDTIVNELSIGELIEITYDQYAKNPSGDYVKTDLFVPYNKYLELHKQAKAESGLFAKDASGNFVPTTDESGETYVNIARYTLCDAEKHAGLDRYALTLESATSITIQSMARRGYLLNEVGEKVDSLFIDELIRVKADSAVIMRSLAKRGTTLNKFADVADELKLSEVIEISADSARIMKSLVARDCLIKDLDKIANDLTLSETVDVKFDEFTPDASGKYVKVVGDGYVFYDKNNPLMKGMPRFKKDASSSPATYVADDNGSFVHDFYFTLYNIATHSDATLYTRYDRTTAESGASSKVLQRLAFSNIGDFSTAFDALTLGDVIDIDPDVLEVADADYKLANPTVTYYAYDETNHVFKRDETGVYYVSRAGEDSAVLKRLAFVPVNSLSTALDTIIKDMLLSELIDVYEQYAVSVDTAYNPTSTPASTIQETDRFIVNPLGYDESGKAYTFVYNQFGKYIERDYAFIPTPIKNLSQNGTVRFAYKKLNNLIEVASAATNGGVYYKHGEEYVDNAALCVYLASIGKFDDLYTRESVTSGGIEAATYSDANLYVEISGMYTPYDSTKLTHLGFDSYFVKTTNEDGSKFYVSTTTPNASDDTSYQYSGKNDDGSSKEPLYSKVYCENIYVKSASGNYVFNGNEYVAYDAAKHDGLDRFDQVVGYLATANETYVKVSGAYAIALPHTQSMVAREGGMIREKSQAVIRMLATKKVTIANIDSVIKTATVGEIMEVTPDSIFEKFADSTINSLNANLQSTITEMSVGELMEFAGVASTNPIVRSALKDVKLKNFFSSLTFNKTVGIVIDMEKACGYPE